MKRCVLLILVILSIILNMSVASIGVEAASPSIQIQNALNSATLNPMKTGHWNMDNKVQEILYSCGYGSLDTYTVVKNCYDYLVNNYHYEMIYMYPYDDFLPGTPTFISEYCDDAYAPLFLGKGDCVNYAYAFVVLTRAIGLNSYVVGNGGLIEATHHWAQINVNGLVYDFDVQSEGAKTKKGKINYIYFGKPGKAVLNNMRWSHFHDNDPLRPVEKFEDIVPSDAVRIYSITDFEKYLLSKSLDDFVSCDCLKLHAIYNLGNGKYEYDTWIPQQLPALHLEMPYLLAPYSQQEMEAVAEKVFNKVIPLKELSDKFLKSVLSSADYNSFVTYSDGKDYKIALKIYLCFENDYNVDIRLYNGGIFLEEMPVDGGSLLINRRVSDLVEVRGYLGAIENVSFDDMNINSGHNLRYQFSDYTFFNCKTLKSVALPKNVLSFGADLFSKCTNLETLLINGDVSTAKYNTFYLSDCTNLKSVIFKDILSWNFMSEDIKKYGMLEDDVIIYTKYPQNNLEYLFPGKKIVYIADVYVNDEYLYCDQSPVIINGRTLVPVRAIFEAFGMTVEWNQETQTVTAKDSKNIISLTINSNDVYINGEKIIADVSAQMINDRTLVPVRIISDCIGAEIQWDDINKRVVIEK